MASDSLVLEMGQKLENWKKRAQEVAKRAEKVTNRFMVGAAGAAGAAACGVLQAELGEDTHFPGSEVAADLTIGGLIVLAGALGAVGDKYADEVVAFGTGLSAPAIARAVRTAMNKG